MAKISFNQIKNYSSGGGSFFTLKPGEEATVRFLYDSYDDVVPFVVHEYTGASYATIDCGRQEGDPIDTCKWCASGNRPVVRVIVPLYNESAGEIQYWKKSGSWVEKELQPMTDEVIKQGAKIASQVYKIKRQGQNLDTKYTLIPLGGPDTKTKADFGEIKSPFDLNMIKPVDCDFDPNSAGANNNNTTAQATRRTADVF